MNVDVMGRVCAQDLQHYFLLLCGTNIHPKQKASTLQLFVHACCVPLMHQTAENRSDQCAAARGDYDGQNRPRSGNYEGANRCEGLSWAE